MKNDPRLFRRRLALTGIGAVGIVGLALIVLWRGSPLPPVGVLREAPIDWTRCRTTAFDHAKRLEEVHRKEAEEMDRWRRLSPEERIDQSTYLSHEEKKRERQELQKERDRDREYEAGLAEDYREMEALVRDQEEKQAQTPERIKPKKAYLRLVVETASVDLLPAQLLTANVHLINEGQEAVLLRTMLAGGYLEAYVKRPGAKEYEHGLFGTRGESDGITEEVSLNSGARWSFQTDLPLGLGYDYSTNVVVLGEYRVRLELTIGDRDKVVADEFTVRVAAPTGDDETVRRQIFAAGLHGFLGPNADITRMFHLWTRPDENLQMASMDDAFSARFRHAVAAVEDLCLRFPNSRYAPDLRVGFLLAARDRGTLAPSPEAKIDLERRIRVMCQTMMDRDGPKSWVRAEILLLAARYAERVGDLPFTEKELHARFASLCPTDVRTPELIPSSKNTGPETDPLLGAEEELKDMTEDEKNALREILKALKAQK